MLTKITRSLALAFLAVILLAGGSQALAQPAMVRVLIGFNRAPSPADEQRLHGIGSSVSHRFHRFPVISILIPETALSALSRVQGVSFVEKDGIYEALEQTMPWGIDRVNADSVHPYNKGAGVKVAVIDTGIDLDHPDLKVAGNVSFVSGTTAGDDDNGHGTHVAGTLAALDNNIGVLGVAPQVELYAVKVLNANGQGYWSDIAAGIEWAADHGMHIANMSLGGSTGSLTLETACNSAYQAGVLLVAAAGNSGNSLGTGDNIIYPAKYASVIAVTATDATDRRAYFSSTGPAAEMAAPGVDIYSTYRNGGYATRSGTSMSSPHVAGVAALVIAAGVKDANGDGRINDDVRAKLQQSTIDLGTADRDNLYGYGLIDASRAVPNTPNRPPTAPVINVVPDQPFTTDNLVAQIVTPSSDPDGDNITYAYAWYKNGALQPALIGNTVAAVNTAKGQVWRCVVTPQDGKTAGPTGEDQVTIRNSPPVASAGLDQVVSLGKLVTLDGSATDADQDTLSYAWTQTGGAAVTLSNLASLKPTFTPVTVGDYTFAFSANDGTVSSQSDSVLITVKPANGPPVLASGELTPAAGDASTRFGYSVNYTDPDNGPPKSITVNIDRPANLWLDFDGKDDYVSLGNLGIAANGPATIEGWFYFDTTAGARGTYMNLYRDWLYQHSANNYLYFETTNDYFAWTASPGVWYHLAVTYGGQTDTAILYINGTAYPCQQQAGSHTVPAFSNMLGSSASSLEGRVDEIRVYTRALSAGEIAGEYALGRTGAPQPFDTAGLAGLWHLDEGAGAVLNDASGNGRSGTVYGAVWQGHPGRLVQRSMAVRPGQDGVFTNGEVYECAIAGVDMGGGEHRFWFSANDGTDNATGDTGVHAGPTVANSPPGAPIVNITPEQPTTDSDLVCNIVTPSVDVDGDILAYKYAWYRDGVLQPALIGDRIPASETTRGEVWRCTVTPNDGAVDGSPAEDQVTIQNTPPIADAGHDQQVQDTDGDGQETVTLSGAASSDPDGSIVSYEWKEGATVLGTGVSINASFTVTGSPHTVTLIVRDNEGATASDTVLITVGSYPTMRLASISMVLVREYSGWRTYARATTTVIDLQGKPVGSATVAGHWEQATSDVDSGITAADGKVTLTSDFRRRPPRGTTYTFVIDSVSKEGWRWDKVGSVLSGLVQVP